MGIGLTEVSRPLVLQEGKILRVLKRLEEVDMTLDILQVSDWPRAQYFMYRCMFSYYYVTVLHLSGYSGDSPFSIRVRVRVWYYFIFCDRYMK